MINAEKILAYDLGKTTISTGDRDNILYALSIGIGMDPCDPTQLAFVYERDLKPFPTMVSVLGWSGRLTDPDFGIDHRKVVASGLDVQWHQPLPRLARLVSQTRVSKLIDKGPGKSAIIEFERTLADDRGPVATVRSSILALGQGGFGGSKDGLEEPCEMPTSPPDRSCDLKTAPNIALLFRLHGDTNPIHVDPELARRSGFSSPLLHGAASFGIAGHALAQSMPDVSVDRFSRMRVRFVKPFFPGDTMRTEIWGQGAQLRFRCRSMESGTVTLDNGRLDLTTPSPRGSLDALG